MDIEKYKKTIAQIDSDAEGKKRAVSREYAMSNNPVKVGDVVSDHSQKIRVERIGVYHSDVPMCLYKGQLLTKAGKPFKNGNSGTVYQRNMTT